MKIFDKRPLSLILCVALCGFVFFTRGVDYLRIAVPTVALTVLLVSFFVKNQDRHTLILMRICSFAIALCSVLSYLYFDIYFFAANRFEDRVSVVGEVSEFDFDGYSNRVEIDCESVNSEPFSRYKLVAYIDNEDTVNVSIGSKISFTALLSDFESYGEDFDSKNYYTSRGYSAVATEVLDFTVLESGDFSLEYKITAYRHSLCRRIINHSDEKSGGLLSALLFGERQYLPKSIQLDFARLGITHILSISGMHLVILVLGLGKLLSLFGVGKKQRKLSEILFTLIYMMLTGFPVSVVRAGLMLIISSLLFLLARSSDSVTNLFIAVALICILQPWSVFDISLWLSALATLGIIVYAEYKQKIKTKRGIKHSLKDALLISVFAISATLVITVTSFGEISLLAPVATLVFSILTEVLMYVGCVFLIVCGFIPLGWLVKFLGNIISELAALLSSFKWVFVSSDFAITKAAVVVFTLLFLAFALLDIKRKGAFVTTITLSLIAIFAISAIFTYSAKAKSEFEYLRSGTDERILMQSDGETAVIDITSATVNTSYDTLKLIKSSKITNVEKYIYTRYSSSLPASVASLLNNVYVDEVYIPTPENETEEEIFNQILNMKENYRARIVFYEEKDIIRSEEFTIFPVYYSSDIERKNAFTILYEDNFYTYLSSGMLNPDSANVARNILDGTHTLILGSRGTSYGNYEFIYKINSLNTLIISSSGVSLPKNTKEFYSDAEIYYTPEIIDLK